MKCCAYNCSVACQDNIFYNFIEMSSLREKVVHLFFTSCCKKIVGRVSELHKFYYKFDKQNNFSRFARSSV